MLFKVTGFQGATISFAAFVFSCSVQSETLCYVPGAGGGSEYSLRQLPQIMKQRNIDFRSYDVENTGSIQAKAQRLREHMQREINRDPSFRCDWLGYSQGGVVARFALNHLTVRHPVLGEVLMKDISTTLTTMATPHQGTPLARIGGDVLGEKLDEGMRQLSEEGMRAFNEQSSAAYSPPLLNKPNFSYRSYMNHQRESLNFKENLGYQAIKQDLKGRGLDGTNDGVVPTESQSWETLVASFNVAHSFWSKSGPYEMTLPDFVEAHHKMLRGALIFDADTLATALEGLPAQLGFQSFQY